MWRSIDFVPFSDMIVYACYSGWRPSEIVEIEVKNVDLKAGFIKGGIKSRVGKNRLVTIHSLVRLIVEKYYEEAIAVNSKFLFNDTSKKKGIGLSYDQYLSRFIKVLEQLNLRDEITPHYTRHTFLSKAKSKDVNMNEYILKLIVGHKVDDLTENTYTYRTLQDLIDEMEKIMV